VAETTTTNFGWTMPDPGASANTWGATLNATTQKIDNQVFLNQQAAAAGQAPIGSVTMFAGPTPPANWLICNGASLGRTGTYAALFAIIGTAFGSVDGSHFNLPNLNAKFPLGVGPSNQLGSAGGAFNTALSIAQLPPHAHPITDVTHNHPQTPHNHGDPSHLHVLPDTPSPALVGQAGVASGTGWGWGPQNTNSSTTGLQAANANISSALTGLSTTQNTGSGSAVPIIPPYQVVNFIIRFQ
jgi:microcystin-dependent protein